jgi:hypothetical protein
MFSYAAATTASQNAIHWSAGMEMLNVYLPRVSTETNLEELQYFLREIAKIDYADFVTIKDQETKAFRHYAVYIKLKEWNSQSRAYQEMLTNKTFKLHISPVEYLLLLPNKTPLPRSKVNTHQLASFTEELFNKVATLENHVAIQGGLINAQSHQLNHQAHQLNQQAHQINWLMKMVTFQKKEEPEEGEEEEEETEVCLVKRITYEGKSYFCSKNDGTIYNMEQDVVGMWNEETQRIDFDDVEDLSDEDEEGEKDISCLKCKRKFDDEKQLHFHESVCLKEGKKEGLEDNNDDFSTNEACIHRLKKLFGQEEESTDAIVKVPWQLDYTNGV